MEVMPGKTSQHLDWTGFWARIRNYEQVNLDLGTGDGRYVRALAGEYPQRFFIGMDACRENLRATSRLNLPNAVFVIANAQALPQEFCGLVSHVTINFPWGSLLNSLLVGDAVLMNELARIAKPPMEIDIRLNGGALAEAGSSLEAGAQVIRNHLERNGWNLKTPCWMDTQRLRALPSTWAKRLAHGRDPRAMMLQGKFCK